MTNKRSNPPSLALWLLRHTSTGARNEALTGDLIERFREGQSRRWFWGQVLFASALGALEAIRRGWYFFAYAIAGTVAQYLLYSNDLARGLVLPGWSSLPWPLSQFGLELGVPIIATSMSLLMLSVGLLIERSFRWWYLLRTFIFSLVLITAGQYSIEFSPWLLRPVQGDQYHKALIALLALLASAYLVAAWLGCAPTKHSHNRERRTTVPQ